MIVGGIPMLFGKFIAPPDQQAFTTAGTYSWVCPIGVTSVSVVAVGAGSNGGVGNGIDIAGRGGKGGSLRYKNAIPVIPGNSYAVVVGGTSSFATVCVAPGASGGTAVGDGGGNGGLPTNDGSGGGGAGGYSGNGGQTDGTNIEPTGGGGGGGSTNSAAVSSGGGGGVGILGLGSNGINGAGGANQGGTGGSGGSSGQPSTNYGVYGNGGIAGLYGGGGGAAGRDSGSGAVGGGGAVRIIWPGTTRAFPTTLTGDL